MKILQQNLHPKTRLMTAEDIPDVYQIEKQSHITPWSEKIFYDCLRVGYTGVVLEYDHTIVAYAMTSSAANISHLLNIAVLPQYQRHGFGKFLMQYLIEDLKKQGIKEIHLEVRVGNVAAITLYKQLGFESLAIRKNYYTVDGGYEDAIMMLLSFE